MISPALDYLMTRLNDIDNLINDVRVDGWIQNELRQLTEEALKRIGELVDVNDFADRQIRRQSLDLDSLQHGITSFESLVKEGTPLRESDLEIDPQQVLAGLRQDLKELTQVASSVAEAAKRAMIISLMNSKFMRLSIYILSRAGMPSDFLTQVLSKLQLLDDSEVAVLWSWVKQEVAGDSGIGDPAIVPPEFDRFEDPASARGKIADYIVVLKPQLIRERVREGHTSYPLGVPGAAQVLAWKLLDASTRFPIEEETFLQVLARTVTTARLSLRIELQEIASALRLSSNEILLEPDLIESAVQHSLNASELRFQLRKLLRVTDQLITRDPPISRCLRQYKLGLEVLLPDIAQEFESKYEIRLQKELCKFLLERNIFAVGTKFGPDETDLVASQPGLVHVIEVKLLKGSVTLSKISYALAQLQTYLDRSPEFPFGILVFYNFTDCPITTPLSRLQGRIQVLAINLHAGATSTRTRSVAIEPGEGGRLIKLVTTGDVMRKTGHKSKKKAARRPK